MPAIHRRVRACLLGFFLLPFSLFAADATAPALPGASSAPSTSTPQNGASAGSSRNYLSGPAVEEVQRGWAVYLEKGEVRSALRFFESAAQKGPVSFLTYSSMSQMLIQQAQYSQAAAVLVQAVQQAPWDEYGEPALRDLSTLLPYLPQTAANVPASGGARNKSAAFAPVGREVLRAALQKRLLNPQIGWIERACVCESLYNVLQLDGEEALKSGYQSLTAQYLSQNPVRQWRLIGPFSNRNREGFSAAQEIEKTVGAPDFQKVWAGRGREVGWFTQDAPADGLLFLDRIFFPGSESLGYACIFVESAEAMPATLAVAAGGASALWLNGREVYSDGVYCRNDGRLQRLIGVALRKGANCLVFKIAGDLKCNAALALRVIPLAAGELDKPGSAHLADGRAGLLRCGLEAGASPAAPDAATPVQEELGKVRLKRVTGNPGVFWGALAEFAQRAQKDDPLALMNVAYLLRERGLSDTDYARERGYNEELAKRYPACPLFLATAAFSQPDENRTRSLLQQALAAGPQERGVADDLLRLALQGGFYDEALEKAQALMKERPTYGVCNAIATIAQNRSWEPEALRALREGLECMPSSGGLLVRLSKLLPSDVERERLLAGSGCAEPGVLAALAGLHFKTGAYEKAGQEYLRLARRVTYEESYWDAAAAARVALGDYAGAAEMTREGLRWMPQSPLLLEKTGRLLLCAGKGEDGRALLARSLAIKRDNPLLQAYLTQLLPQEKAFYERVDLPFSELKGRDLQSKDYPDFDTAILLDQCFIRVNPNGTAQRMYRSVVKVLRQRGADDAAQMQIPYAPGSQRATVVRARVWRPDGSYADNAQISDNDYGEDGSASLMYGSGGRVRYVALPEVKEGSIVDFQWTVEDNGEQLYHNEFCDNYFFGGMEPAVRFRYTIEYPEQMPLRFALANADYQPKRTLQNGIACLDWDEKDIPGIKPEPAMPPYSEIKAQLGVSTFRDWNTLGAWAWNLFQPQMELTAEMKQKVAALTENAKTREEKIRAIYDFVVDEIRYVSISFGRFGYVPHKVERTFQSRYGDCKDTAALFVAMLQEAGVEARPVLVRSRDEGAEPLGLPASDSYNHSIAYVPAVGKDGEGGKHYWLDGTVDYHPFQMIPFMDRGTKALVFGPGKGEQVVIDPAAPEQCLDETTVEATLQPGGAGMLLVHNLEHGEGAMDYMQLLEKPESLKYMLSTVVQERYPGGTVSDIQCSAPGKVQEATFSFQVSSKTLARNSAGEYRLKTSFFPLDLSGLTSLPARHYDLLLGQPRITRKGARIVLPAGARFKTTPGNLELQTPAAGFVRKAEVKDGVLTLQAELTIRYERVKPAEYAEFKRFCNAVSAAMEETVSYADPGDAQAAAEAGRAANAVREERK